MRRRPHCRQPCLFNVHLVGREGTLCDDKLWSTRVESLRKDAWIDLPASRAESGDVRAHPYPPQVDEFGQCLLEGKDSRITFEGGFHTHRIMFAIKRSLAEGRSVRLAEMG